MLSPGSLAVIGVVALIVFGPKKLPELGKAAGQTLREFKRATSGLLGDDSKDKEAEEKKSVPAEAEAQGRTMARSSVVAESAVTAEGKEPSGQHEPSR